MNAAVLRISSGSEVFRCLYRWTGLRSIATSQTGCIFDLENLCLWTIYLEEALYVSRNDAARSLKIEQIRGSIGEIRTCAGGSETVVIWSDNREDSVLEADNV